METKVFGKSEAQQPETEFEARLIKKFPLQHLEKEFEKIEKLGYTIGADESSCQIWKGDNLIIDADYLDGYHLNAAHAIDGFLR